MNKEIHREFRKEFQLERLILFSDAVFAIAITLLVIDIKVPEIAGELLSEEALGRGIWHLLPKFIGFFVSFMIIGLYWTVHHRLFGFVVAYNQRLLWLNLIFLMAVVLMPFSSAFYSDYMIRFYRPPVVIYVANISFLGTMNFVLWRYIANPRHKLSEALSAPVARYYSLRAIVVPMVFLAMGIVYFFAPGPAVFIPALTPLLMKLLFGKMRRKLGAQPGLPEPARQ